MQILNAKINRDNILSSGLIINIQVQICRLNIKFNRNNNFNTLISGLNKQIYILNSGLKMQILNIKINRNNNLNRLVLGITEKIILNN